MWTIRSLVEYQQVIAARVTDPISPHRHHGLSDPAVLPALLGCWAVRPDQYVLATDRQTNRQPDRRTLPSCKALVVVA